MLNCPKDHKPLESVRQDKQHRCVECRGNLVVSSKLFQVVKDRFHIVRNLKPIQCPYCKFKMKHYRFKTRHLDVDGCPKCEAFWFDHGEMKAINEFIIRYHKETKAAIGAKDKKSLTQEQEMYRQYMEHQGFEGDLSLDQVLVQVFLGLPAEHNLPSFRTPVVTYSLIAINVLAFVLASFIFGPELMREYSFIPESDPFYKMITAMFCHAGWMHLLGNVYILKVLGDNVEDLVGRRGFLLLFLSAGIMGWVASIIFSLRPDVPHLGASGAVAGVTAAYFYLFPKMKFSFRFLYLFNFNVTAKVVAVLWIIQQFFIMRSGVPVAWDAHLGGFMAGLLYAYIAKKNHLI